MVWPILVWPILSFQGSYVNVHLWHIYFLVLKMSWKIISGTVWSDRYFPFQGFYQVFFKDSCFFLSQKSSRILNHGQYDLTYIIHLENIGQFLSKADSLKDSTYISFKNSFFAKIFFKNFNQRQYGLIYIVHLVNVGQSLSKTHIVWSTLNFAMFVVNSDQAKQMFETYWLKLEPYCPFKDSA